MRTTGSWWICSSRRFCRCLSGVLVFADVRFGQVFSAKDGWRTGREGLWDFLAIWKGRTLMLSFGRDLRLNADWGRRLCFLWPTNMYRFDLVYITKWIREGGESHVVKNWIALGVGITVFTYCSCYFQGQRGEIDGEKVRRHQGKWRRRRVLCCEWFWKDSVELKEPTYEICLIGHLINR